MECHSEVGTDWRIIDIKGIRSRSEGTRYKQTAMEIKRELLFMTGVNCETAFSPAVKRDSHPPPPHHLCSDRESKYYFDRDNTIKHILKLAYLAVNALAKRTKILNPMQNEANYVNQASSKVHYCH